MHGPTNQHYLQIKNQGASNHLAALTLWILSKTNVCILTHANMFRTNYGEVVIAWVSTRRGDATATAILLLIITLVCLIQIQKYLIAKSEIEATSF